MVREKGKNSDFAFLGGWHVWLCVRRGFFRVWALRAGLSPLSGQVWVLPPAPGRCAAGRGAGRLPAEEGSGSGGWGWCAAERGGGSRGGGGFLNGWTCLLAELPLRWRRRRGAVGARCWGSPLPCEGPAGRPGWRRQEWPWRRGGGVKWRHRDSLVREAVRPLARARKRARREGGGGCGAGTWSRLVSAGAENGACKFSLVSLV